MKSLGWSLILTILLSSFSNPCSAIDKNILWAHLTFSDTPESTKEAFNLAYSNLDLVEEILFIPDSEKDNVVARSNSLLVLRNSSLAGLISSEKYFSITLRLLSQIAMIAHPSRAEAERRIIKFQLSSYASNEAIPLKTKFLAFPTLITSIFSNGLIKNRGILNSLTQKIGNAYEVIDKNGVSSGNVAINIIESAINECEALRGKGISEDGYQIISEFCKALIAGIPNSK